MVAKVKGFVVLSRREFVISRFGAPAWERVLSAMTPEDRAALEGVVLASSWIGLPLCERLDEAIIAQIGGRAEAAFRELGRQSADQNLVKYQAGFLRGRAPQSFLAQAPAIYRLYYEKGERRHEATGPESAALVTTGAENVTSGDCLTVMGWHERALELIGAKEIRITHPHCVARKAKECRYELSWKWDAAAAPDRR